MSKKIREFLVELGQLDITVRLKGDSLAIDAPKGAMTAGLRDRLVGMKSDMIQFFKDADAGLEAPSLIEPIPRGEYLAASFSQKPLWFMEQFTPNNPAYYILVSVRMRGPLQRDLLQRSLNHVYDRQESLRTVFVTVNGEPKQAIKEGQQLQLEVKDLQHYPDFEREEVAQRLRREEVNRPFSLEHGPLVRCTLLRLTEEDHFFLVTMHHIISDGWSMGQFLEEVQSSYRAYYALTEPELIPLPVQFADFASWQQSERQQKTLAENIAFWKEQLSDAQMVLELPTDRSRPAKQTFNGGWFTLRLPKALRGQLKELSRNEGTTLFMVLFTAFNALLHRYTNQEDLLIGTPVANRALEEVENLIGFFVNTLVLRTQPNPEQTFRELLKLVHTRTLKAYAHQDCPFELVVEHLKPARDISRNPVFQVMFVLHNTPLPAMDLPELEIEEPQSVDGGAKFDLTLYVQETEAGMSVDIEYNADLFNHDTIARMSGHYQTLLEGVAAQPGLKVYELAILRDAERNRMLEDWNDTKIEYPQKCPYQLFSEQAAAHPERIALIYEKEEISYRDLNQRVNRVAHYLLEEGIGPDRLVGISLKRTPNMIISQLAIQKAGGAYVPLDPNYPPERIEYILEEAAIPVLLTQQDLVARFKDYEVLKICLDTEAEKIAGLDSSDPEPKSLLHHLSHIIYTSGSTGKPKGVAIEHRSMAVLTQWCSDFFTAEELSGVLGSTTLNFDISVLETVINPALGGTTILVENALYLPSAPNAHRVKLINTVPSAIKALLHMKGIPRSVTTVTLIGEPLKNAVVQGLYSLKHMERVYNLYGPAEDTTYSTWSLMERGEDYVVSIGYPLANTRAYVLDPQLQLVPVGVTGELYLAGEGLARGYLNRQDLTDEKFITDPFQADPKARMYRTGDLTRWWADGQLECLGRIDHQVKIRGFRVELGEIEAQMNRHEPVREAFVMDRDDKNGEKILVGYVTLHKGKSITGQDVRNHLKEHLPDYMVPPYIMVLEAMPLNPNGKIERKDLPDPQATPSEPASDIKKSDTSEGAGETQKTIAEVWKEVLHLEQVGHNDNFFDLGGHSLLLTQAGIKLNEILGRTIAITDLFAYPTIATMAAFLSPREAGEADTSNTQSIRTTGKPDVAVIGMSGRFPGAANIDQFWDNLCNGVESITFFSDETLREAGVPEEMIQDPDYVKARAVLEDVEIFDADFFGYSRREAQIMDPQQRIFLEETYKALEDAGYNPETYPGRIGVYAGTGMATYLQFNLVPNRKLVDSVGQFQLMITNDKDFIASRVAYKMNLKGPAVNVQTACSTSLVAIHMACRALLSGECDQALAGGAGIEFPQIQGYLYQEGGIFTSDGHVRTFDAEGKGMLAGGGVGAVLLKRLDDAIADGDFIRAVVKGSALNNDGSVKVGYTAPSVGGQQEAITDAFAIADVDPATITYVEAHGTATPMGDPIEIAALTKAYRERGATENQYCAIGSVKTNVGHLDSAAGIISFIKTTLALQHKRIPASLHYKQSNPNIDFPNSPFMVNTSTCDWQVEGIPRRAGVSSFGIGGTNAHLIMEEAPLPAPPQPARAWQCLPLSARTEASRDRRLHDLKTFLQHKPSLNPADVAYTLQVGRRNYDHRAAVVCSDLDDATESIEASTSKHIVKGTGEAKPRTLVFMFSGQGAQYVNMARDLYREEPVFREHVDYCSTNLIGHLGVDLRQLLYPNGADGPALEEQALKDASERINRTSMAQPALFVIEYATAKLWQSWGITPDAMIGHSIGEYVAATLAGVMEIDAALALVATRGRLMQSMPGGSMLALPLSEEEAAPYLSEQVQLATINAPKRCVLAGPDDAIKALKDRLKEDGKNSSILHTSHAFHSAMMDGCLAPFQAEVDKVPLQAPKIKYISNSSGTWISEAEATDPQYYTRHLRGAVRFADGLQTLFEGEDKLFLEVGPGKTLMTFARQQAPKGSGHTAQSSIRHPNDAMPDGAFLQTSLAGLWVSGQEIDWLAVDHGTSRNRVPLPTYPFERNTFWIDPPKPEEAKAVPIVREPAPQPAVVQTSRRGGPPSKKDDIGDWFYLPLWKQFPSAPLFERDNLMGRTENWLIFSDLCGLGARVAERLLEAGQRVAQVEIGETYSKRADRTYAVKPTSQEDYSSVFRDLNNIGQAPNHIVHLWSVTSERRFQDRLKYAKTCQERGFLSLLTMIRAYEEQGHNEHLQLAVVSNSMHEVTDGDLTCPEKATLLGPCRVIPREYPHIKCRSIDVMVPHTGPARKILVDQLLGELTANFADTSVAYRGRRRWLPSYEPVRLKAVPERNPVRVGGTYLIVGGLGTIGMAIAEHLARDFKAQIVLTGRSHFPDPKSWNAWLKDHDEGDPTAIRIRKLQAFEGYGAKIMSVGVDVTDRVGMADLMNRIQDRFGAVNGVIHAGEIPPSGTIAGLYNEKASAVIAPKLMGTLVLDELFADKALDFMLLFSSTSAILGNRGYVDYCAGNAFLDAYAHHHNADGGFSAISINWDSWEDTSPGTESQAERVITASEGIEALGRILGGNLFSQIVVSQLDLRAELEDIYAFEREQVAQISSAPAAPRISHTVATAPQSAPTAMAAQATAKAEPAVLPAETVHEGQPTPEASKPGPDLVAVQKAKTVEMVGELWREGLGVDEINPETEFMELGGDSLLATMLASRLRRLFKVKVPPSMFDEHPTITAMAAAIDVACGRAGVSVADLKEAAPTPTESSEPAPDTDKQSAAQAPSSHAPQTDSERTLLALWEEVLGTAGAINGDFIALGGNLRQAEKLSSRISETFGVKLEPQLLMDNATIAGLAEQIDTIRWAASKDHEQIGEDDDDEFEL